MKNTTAIVLIVIILIGGYFVLTRKPVNEIAEATYFTFSSPEIELQFKYRIGPDGYVIDDLTELVGKEQEGVEIVKALRVMNAREKEELEASEGGREGPPTITLVIFKNSNNQSASLWADSHPQFSLMGLVIGDVDRDAVVSGANAIRYRTDGLYLSNNVVVAHGEFVYLFNGSFLEEDSTIYQDFLMLVESVEFIPSESMNQNTKIDIRIACESALSYSLFTSGEEADSFVEECVKGEHPEVIERYIMDMGFNEATI